MGATCCKGTRVGVSMVQRGSAFEVGGASGGLIRWKRGELIGRGAHGCVYLGLNMSSGSLMAVKEIVVPVEDANVVEILCREIETMRSLQHHHVVRYMGTEVQGTTLFIFTDIAAILEQFGCLSEVVVQLYTRQILEGLAFLHANSIVHRDIKGGTNLVDTPARIKVADFGASKQLSTLGAGASRPSVIRGQDASFASDVWSVGCTVYQMICGAPPWKELGVDNTLALLYAVATATQPPQLPDGISDSLSDFLSKCLDLDPEKRPTMAELLHHPFLEEDLSLLDGENDESTNDGEIAGDEMETVEAGSYPASQVTTVARGTQSPVSTGRLTARLARLGSTRSYKQIHANGGRRTRVRHSTEATERTEPSRADPGRKERTKSEEGAGRATQFGQADAEVSRLLDVRRGTATGHAAQQVAVSVGVGWQSGDTMGAGRNDRAAEPLRPRKRASKRRLRRSSRAVAPLVHSRSSFFGGSRRGSEPILLQRWRSESFDVALRDESYCQIQHYLQSRVAAVEEMQASLSAASDSGRSSLPSEAKRSRGSVLRTTVLRMAARRQRAGKDTRRTTVVELGAVSPTSAGGTDSTRETGAADESQESLSPALGPRAAPSLDPSKHPSGRLLPALGGNPTPQIPSLNPRLTRRATEPVAVPPSIRGQHGPGTGCRMETRADPRDGSTRGRTSSGAATPHSCGAREGGGEGGWQIAQLETLQLTSTAASLSSAVAGSLASTGVAPAKAQHAEVDEAKEDGLGSKAPGCSWRRAMAVDTRQLSPLRQGRRRLSGSSAPNPFAANGGLLSPSTPGRRIAEVIRAASLSIADDDGIAPAPESK